jgi:hypothetical protein
MHSIALGQENRTLSEYIDRALGVARRMNEVDFVVEARPTRKGRPRS